MKRLLLAMTLTAALATSASAQSAPVQLPTGDQAVVLGACASAVGAGGAALGLSLAVPGAAAVWAVLSLGCMIIAGGG
jgi:hypothetical protein